MAELAARPRDRFINRELSWLDFNQRVLTLADDPDLPLLERVKFLAIFATNLDEFYMVRVAGLKRQAEAGIGARSPDGMTPQEQIGSIAEKALPLVEHHARLFSDTVMPMLSEQDIRVVRCDELEPHQRTGLEKIFREQVFPVLTPLAVDPGRPFPYISNLSLNLAVTVRDSKTKEEHFARVKVPPLLPRFMPVSPDDNTFVPLEDVIAANLDDLFPGMEIVEHYSFRVTRNADLEIEGGADDLLEALEEELRKRRFSPAVRLEIERSMPEQTLDLLMTELEVSESDVHALSGPLDLSGLWALYDIDRPDLKYEPFVPATDVKLTSADEEIDMFDVIRSGDVLVHHPYESFATSTQRFIEQAANDPDVLAIKQTLYRTHGSPIVDALIEAAEAGKQVVVLVEIKARFDEHANIRWVRALEQAGCHVVYGLVGLKTHCKLCLVVRREGKDKLRRYVHVGTGNYNPTTARIYEDLGLLTADRKLGTEVNDLFNYLTGFSRNKRYRAMMVAPHGMRKRIIRLIDREANSSTPERPGRIAMKLNSLVDPQVIDALYRASQAGVRVDLVVRGICSLRPGVPGLSDNISVRSIVGRFLEHSRIYYFQRTDKSDHEEIYIGSADLMPRNLNGRVETLVKVKASDLKETLKGLIDMALADNMSSWILEPDGVWRKQHPGPDEEPLDYQPTLMHRALGDA